MEKNQYPKNDFIEVNQTKLDEIKEGFIEVCKKCEDYGVSKRHNEIDNYIVRITQPGICAIKTGQYEIAKIFFRSILAIINRLNKEGAEEYDIHRGTPYYFLSLAYILLGDLERGFLIMHQAYEEDKKTTSKLNHNPKDLPAYEFVTLRSTGQFASGILESIEGYLQEKIKKYNESYDSNFDIADLKNKFLQKEDFIDIVFFFVFQTFKVMSIQEFNIVDKQDFESLLQMDLLFNFCLIIENILSKRYPNLESQRTINRISYKEIEKKYEQNNNVLLSKKDFNGLFKKGHATLRNFLDNFIKDSEITPPIADIVFDGKYKYKKEDDFSIVYAMRNVGGHNIKFIADISNNFSDLVQGIFNVLFCIIEKEMPSGVRPNVVPKAIDDLNATSGTAIII